MCCVSAISLNSVYDTHMTGNNTKFNIQKVQEPLIFWSLCAFRYICLHDYVYWVLYAIHLYIIVTFTAQTSGDV